jgi:hypothetical protein
MPLPTLCQVAAPFVDFQIVAGVPSTLELIAAYIADAVPENADGKMVPVPRPVAIFVHDWPSFVLL